MDTFEFRRPLTEVKQVHLSSPFPLQHQDGWRCCQKCRGLFYGGSSDPGACPSGGKHDGTTSNDYKMAFGDPGAGMQASWRWCKKCQGIFYAGGSTSGACPADGEHDGSVSLAYDMYFEGPPGLEIKWRWCAKCEGLFSLSNDNGICPTGGQHDGSRSAPYGMTLGALPTTLAGRFKPQLFLVETYQLSTFKGRMVLGDPVESRNMDPGEHRGWTVRTKTMQAEEIKQSSTVVFDQTSESTTKFNQQLQELSDNKSSGEHYDYNFQANAHAEGKIGFGKASADAHVDAAGSTNDAREEIAHSIGNAIDSQITQANQVRRDQTITGDKTTNAQTQTETEHTVELRNDSDRTLNIGVFQLKQELITLLSLVEVQVAFRNGDRNNERLVKLFDLDSLLTEVVATAEEASTIKNQIRAALGNIRDYMDESKSILVQDATQTGTLVINKRLTSTYELKNTEGSTEQAISVPGIIITAYSPKYIYLPGIYMSAPMAL
jgi:hypothetical protein